MGYEVSIDASWFDNAMADGGNAWLERLGEEITDDAILGAPKVTGDLAGSIGFEVDQARHEVRIGSGVGEGKEAVPYAASVELGNPPHDIPNAFGRGETVHHPGYDAQPYLTPALYKARD